MEQGAGDEAAQRTSLCEPPPSRTTQCSVKKGTSAKDAAAAARAAALDFDTFGIQYWGQDYTAGALAEAPHDALIIEPAHLGADASASGREELFSAEEVAAITRDGARPTFGYLNVGELSTYRDYWVDACGAGCGEHAQPVGAPARAGADSAARMPGWFGAENERNELLSAFWSHPWESLLLRRIDQLLDRGYQGVFLDDVLHYYSWGSDPALACNAVMRGGPGSMAESARAMMALVVRLARYAHHEAPAADPGFSVIVNGAPYIGWDAMGPSTHADGVGRQLVAEYLGSIDGILVENLFGRSDAQALLRTLRDDFAACGIAVLAVEYWSGQAQADVPFDAFSVGMRELAAEHGFRVYVVGNGNLDRLYPPTRPALGHDLSDKSVP